MSVERVPATPPGSTVAGRPHPDHVAALIDRHFDRQDGLLCIGGWTVRDLSERFGTPLFVYDGGLIERRIADVRQALPARFRLFYSIKANPNAALLKRFLQHDCGLEVASAGELHQALAAGAPPERILFAGPGKTAAELQQAVAAGIGELHLESVDEARLLDAAAQQQGRTMSVALRINPQEDAGGAMRMGGCPSPFGIDEEELDAALEQILSLPRLRVVGVHLFMGTQILAAETLLAQYERAVKLARAVAVRLPHRLQTIDFGGGWGTPYFPHEGELDLQAVASGLAKLVVRLEKDPLLRDATAILEPGRFLVNEAGVYLSQVTRVKRSRGKVFAVLDGGMHHHLAASGNLGQTIKRNYPVAFVNKLGRPASATVEVVGPLCTPLDALARKVSLPEPEAGDLFGVFQSGAYARTSSPLGFLSHLAPAEVLVQEGQATLIRRRGHVEDPLRDQCCDPPVSVTCPS